MKRFKGTKGKWIAKDASPEIGFDIIDYPRGDIVAKIRYELIKEIGYYGLDAENEDKAIANKDLIATAPELLDALIELVKAWESLEGIASQTCDPYLKAKQIMNKALGQ